MEQALQNWKALNEFLRKADEAACKAVLEAERNSAKPRLAFLMRLHGRYNVLRAERERAELLIPDPKVRRGKANRR